MVAANAEALRTLRPGRAYVHDLDPTARLSSVALRASYSEHCPAARRLACRILGDVPAAEDVVQDAFMKLWMGTAQFDSSRGSMRGLLMTIVRHTALDLQRGRKRRQRTENLYCAEAGYTTEGPERALERSEEARQVQEALLALPGEQRRAIEMAYFTGLSRAEIAVSSAVSVGTVKSRIRLGVRRMASSLTSLRAAASSLG